MSVVVNEPEIDNKLSLIQQARILMETAEKDYRDVLACYQRDNARDYNTILELERQIKIIKESQEADINLNKEIYDTLAEKSQDLIDANRVINQLRSENLDDESEIDTFTWMCTATSMIFGILIGMFSMSFILSK